jgi:hypothetical protein
MTVLTIFPASEDIYVQYIICYVENYENALADMHSSTTCVK